MGKIEGRASLEVKTWSLVSNLFILRHLFKCIITRLETCKLRKNKKKKKKAVCLSTSQMKDLLQEKQTIVFNITKGSHK